MHADAEMLYVDDYYAIRSFHSEVKLLLPCVVVEGHGYRLDLSSPSYPVITVGSTQEQAGRLRKGKEDKVLAISVIGDSYSAGQDFYLSNLTQRLARNFGFAGPGYVGFNHGTAVGGTSFKYTRSNPKYFGGDWRVSDLGQASPDSRTVTGGAGAYIEIDASDSPVISTSVTKARLLYLGTGKTDELRYRWAPSDAWKDLTISGSGVQGVDLPILPQGNDWEFRLEVVNGDPTLFGMWLANSNGGVRVSKLAASGSASGDWYKNDSHWQAQWKAVVSMIPTDMYLIMLGGNDQGFGVKPVDYLENIKGLVRMIRDMDPAADIHLIVRQDTTRSSAYPMADYAQILERWAFSEKIAFSNLQCAFGYDFKRYASDGPTPMIGPDKIHPIPDTGGRIIADFFYRLIVGGGSEAATVGECGTTLK